MGDIILNVTQASVNTYATAGQVVTIPATTQKVLIQLTEKNVNAIKYKILASNAIDANGALTEAVELKAETVIAKNGADYQTISDPWRYIDVEFAANAGGSQGSLKLVISGA